MLISYLSLIFMILYLIKVISLLFELINFCLIYQSIANAETLELMQIIRPTRCQEHPFLSE